MKKWLQTPLFCAGPAPIFCFQSSHPLHAEHPDFLVWKMRDMAEPWEDRVAFPRKQLHHCSVLPLLGFLRNHHFSPSCSVKVPKSPCNRVKETPIHYFPKIFVPEDSPTLRVPGKQIQTELRRGHGGNYLEDFQICVLNLFENWGDLNAAGFTSLWLDQKGVNGNELSLAELMPPLIHIKFGHPGV